MTSIRSGKPHPRRWNTVLMGLGFVFQCLFLSERGQLHNRCPITNGAEILVFISWSIVIMYFVLGRAFRLSLLGVFSAPIVFVFQSIGLLLLLRHDPGAQPSLEIDRWLEMHASTSLLAYGAFALAAIAGVMYIVQDRQLKKRETGQLFHNLPPIRYLAQALVRLLFIGLVLTTAGIVSAFLMKTHPSPLHLASSGAVWLVYATILAIQSLKHPATKSLSQWTILAFLFALITLSAL
ncbi:MAG: cytochrome c biogenesis protein CcsA [Methylococcales bacterium]|nr:cytochrome c biogenesis protein CcsA [Methylococcales bacterium]